MSQQTHENIYNRKSKTIRGINSHNAGVILDLASLTRSTGFIGKI